jgi:hypothetical protein
MAAEYTPERIEADRAQEPFESPPSLRWREAHAETMRTLPSGHHPVAKGTRHVVAPLVSFRDSPGKHSHEQNTTCVVDKVIINAKEV